jgi:hypothetical protein
MAQYLPILSFWNEARGLKELFIMEEECLIYGNRKFRKLYQIN